MKRTGIRRSSPETIRAWQRRSKPIKRSNPARRRKTYERNYGDRGEPVRAMQCLVEQELGTRSRCLGDIQAAHAIPRKMGGHGGDRRALVPLCARHHEEAGEYRTSQRKMFEAWLDIDLVAKAEALAVELDEQGYL